MDKRQLNERRFEELFIKNLEADRANLGISQNDMAKIFNMSPSAYKRVITGETKLKGLFVVGALYNLTGKFCFEYVECHDETLDLISDITKLSPDDRNTIKALVNHLKEASLEASINR